LLAQREISVVYALNRPATGIHERQRASFVKNGINVELMTSQKLRLLEGDLTTAAFGLAPEDLTEIRTRVTCIIHNGESPLSTSSSAKLTMNSMASRLQFVALVLGALR
jgi:thioester reductase-like protein